MIKNPFIETSPVIYQKDVPKELLIKRYKEIHNIDINSIFSGADKISIYKCRDSEYCFYYPFEVAGDSNFYEKLQENDWYYMPWKWEHQLCEKYIKENDKILEVGCGRGAFLKNISEKFKNIKCVGLELNKSSVFSSDKLEIQNITVEDFSRTNEGVFDIVCSFQVLEHIPLVNSFLKANIKCLADNGLLIICVPNNNSFIKHSKYNILNMPPHHMGLWTENSLRKIGDYFNMEVVEVAFEPLQKYHYEWYLNILINRFTGKYLSGIVMKFIDLVKLKGVLLKLVKRRANKIKGHSILIVLKKVTAKK
jgi:SAM-dependent methyltransferase